MGTGNLLTIIQNLAAFFTGPGGVSLCVLGIALAGLYSVFEHHFRPVGWAITGAAITISAAWIVSTWLGASASSL